jgi:hypothetical protein
MADSVVARARDEIRTELQAALAAVLPYIEGVKNLQRLPLEPPTRAAVDGALEQLETRRVRLERAIAALVALDELLDNGYPAPIALAVAPDVVAELRHEDDVMDLARQLFSIKSEAVSATFKTGPEHE